ncbi:hypothetical protein Aperf_G00000030099 [Anoplocephala perfoliata]
MESGRLELLSDLQVVGFRCTLFSDPEKTMEINSGKFLVPWGKNTDITIDRYDCRGYLQDLSEYDADNVHRVESQTAEESGIEELCNYERYLELQTDIHEENAIQEEERKRREENLEDSYAAVGFSYTEGDRDGSSHLNNHDKNDSNSSHEQNQVSKDYGGEPYICPPELILPSDMILPEFDRQAAIIEKTAIFIARNNAQMEIVLKTKQSNNPQFKFLNYDDKLNPFYKELVKLIKSGRYIPRHRPNLDTSKTEYDSAEIDNNPDEPYELKLPKVDISTTAYASLINRFKKSNDDRSNSNSETENGLERDGEKPAPDNQKESSVSDGAQVLKAEESSYYLMSNEDYEHCYQEYYRHYYSYYYMHFSSTTVGEPVNESWIIAESARAAATAALAAVNAVRQSHLVSSSISTSPPADLRGIIDKMAEYVARNGDEFQEVVKNKKQDDPRFAFLQIGHIHHDYYLIKKAEFATKFRESAHKNDAKMAHTSDVRESKNETVKREDSPSCDTAAVVKNKSISFRLTKSASSNRLKGMDEPCPSPPVIDDEAANLNTPSSCAVLPGICNYSSDSDSEDVDADKQVSPQKSPIPNEVKEEGAALTSPGIHSANLSADSQTAPSVVPIVQKSPSPQGFHNNAKSRSSSPSVGPNSNSTGTAKPTVVGTILTAEEIARDIQSMEEEARLQLERRKRAALFAAKLQAAKLRKMEFEAEEEVKRERRKRRSTPPLPPPLIPSTVTAAPPPPPSSVPAAVANAVAAQLKTQRERALEAAAAATIISDPEKNKTLRTSRSPPSAYAKHRRRSSSRSSEDTYSRSRRRHSRSRSNSYERGHSRRSRHHKHSGQRT